MIFHIMESDVTRRQKLPNTVVTHNSCATCTSKYLTLQLRVTRESAGLKVQTPEWGFFARPLFIFYTLYCRVRVLESRVLNECDVAFERYCIMVKIMLE